MLWVLLMSSHNKGFRAEIRKIFTGYPLLSRPMCLGKSIKAYVVGTHLYCLFTYAFIKL